MKTIKIILSVAISMALFNSCITKDIQCSKYERWHNEYAEGKIDSVEFIYLHKSQIDIDNMKKITK